MACSTPNGALISFEAWFYKHCAPTERLALRARGQRGRPRSQQKEIWPRRNADRRATRNFDGPVAIGLAGILTS